ncbi:MAG: cobalamin-dependent protein [Actinomycetota bacterium]|nr:cobalamin-dependent protein [Actinomycetota bacterium]MDD5667052.1 cobalamin-dependent protein [Actinomycetota bacterium]
MGDDLVKALVDLDEDKVRDVVKSRLEAGDDPLGIMDDARKAMEVVGDRFAEGEYFIPELVFAGEILKDMTTAVKPYLNKASEQKYMGKVVLGTVAGDIHDIGKDIVGFMLDVNGFEVHDLGVDVPPRKFVEKVQETESPILALSGFLTLAYDSMKETVEALADAGLRDKVKVMIGGGQISDEIRAYTGADEFGKDAMAGVALAKKFIAAE